MHEFIELETCRFGYISIKNKQTNEPTNQPTKEAKMYL